MTPRRLIYVIAISAGGLLGVLIYLSAEREPMYAGKTLREWVHQLKSRDSTEQRAAVAALRQLGSKPLPRLRKMLRARDTAAKRLVKRWSTNVRFLKFRFMPACEQHKIAADIVSWMGKPEVIPDLSALLDNPACRCEFDVAQALTRLMPAATPAFLKALTNQNEAVRWVAAANLADSPSDLVITNLVSALRDVSSGVRMVAAVSLGEMQRRPDLIVPSLSDLLEDDPEPSTRASVARALGKFGSDATRAISGLELLSSDTNSVVARAAAEALGRIRSAAK